MRVISDPTEFARVTAFLPTRESDWTLADLTGRHFEHYAQILPLPGNDDLFFNDDAPQRFADIMRIISRHADVDAPVVIAFWMGDEFMEGAAPLLAPPRDFS